MLVNFHQKKRFTDFYSSIVYYRLPSFPFLPTFFEKPAILIALFANHEAKLIKCDTFLCFFFVVCQPESQIKSGCISQLNCSCFMLLLDNLKDSLSFILIALIFLHGSPFNNNHNNLFAN